MIQFTINLVPLQNKRLSYKIHPLLLGLHHHYLLTIGRAPVAFSNREWESILGNFPFSGPGGGTNYPANTNIYGNNYGLTPYVQAPNSSHIVWRRLSALSGIIGGDIQDFVTNNVGGVPTIIYDGNCYQTLTKTMNGVPQTVWECYDLRTGQVLWDNTVAGSEAPTNIETTGGLSEVTGTEQSTVLLNGASLVYIGQGQLIKYDVSTGAVTLNVSIAPLMSGTYFADGYALSVQDFGSARS